MAITASATFATISVALAFANLAIAIGAAHHAKSKPRTYLSASIALNTFATSVTVQLVVID